MAARDAGKIYRVEGKLLAAASFNFAAAFPYGGTELGTCHEITVIPVPRADPVLAEEYGGEEVETVHLGFGWLATAVVRGWDPDALEIPFTGVSADGTGAPVVSMPDSSFEEGDLYTSRATAFAFVATDDRYPSLLLPRATPLVSQTARLKWALLDELSAVVAFRVYRNGSGKHVKFARRAAL